MVSTRRLRCREEAMNRGYRVLSEWKDDLLTRACFFAWQTRRKIKDEAPATTSQPSPTSSGDERKPGSSLPASTISASPAVALSDHATSAFECSQPQSQQQADEVSEEEQDMWAGRRRGLDSGSEIEEF